MSTRSGRGSLTSEFATCRSGLLARTDSRKSCTSTYNMNPNPAHAKATKTHIAALSSSPILHPTVVACRAHED